MECSDVLTIVSILLGVLAYGVDKYLARRDKTLQALNELIRCYNEKISKKEKEKDYFLILRRFLGEVERVCISVDSYVYSAGTMKKYGSKFLIMLYDKNKEYIIEKTRKDFNDDSKFLYFEKLVDKFKRS